MTTGKKCYVYVFRDPRPGKDRQQFYVGWSGRKYRYDEHMRDVALDRHKNKLFAKVVKKIQKAGLQPVFEKINYFDTKEEAVALEIEMIDKIGCLFLRTGPLCNLTLGGEGTVGRVVPPEHTERLRKRNADPNFQKKAHRARRANPDYQSFLKDSGARLSKLNADPDFLARRAIAVRKKFSEPGFAEAHTERLRQLQSDPKYKARISKMLAKRNADPVFQEKRAKIFSDYLANPEKIKARTERTREKWRDDTEFKKAQIKRATKRIQALNNDPEFKRARIERTRKQNSDPAWKKAAADRMRALRANPEFLAKMFAAKRAGAERRALARAKARDAEERRP